MRITGNEIWFDSTLVGHLELGTHCFDTVLRVLEEAPSDTPEWQHHVEDAAEIGELKAEIENLTNTYDADLKAETDKLNRELEGLERENLRQFRQIEALEAQILRLQNRVAELGGGVE